MKTSQKHLTLSNRITIEQSLNQGISFKSIAKQLHKDPTTISKEIRKHRTLKNRKDNTRIVKCNNIKECNIKHLCSKANCSDLCKDCSNYLNCRTMCKDYKIKTCGKLNKAPYVCNSCKSLTGCTYERLIYVAKYADDCYQNTLRTSREGINQTPESMQELDKLVSPLILKGQSLSHIYSAHINDICCSRRTLYKYI